MAIILQNQNIELHIDEPLEGYVHSRFDWTGKITVLKFRDTLVSGYENINNLSDPTLGRGFYNEFGMASTPGFDEARPGDWFHKLGIGLLRKEEPVYHFNNSFEIDPARFAVQQEANNAIITCKVAEHSGYAYSLTKTISLLYNGFEIRYLLENVGRRAIITTEYNHNFLLFQNPSNSKPSEITFPIGTQLANMNEVVNPEGIVQYNKGVFSLNGNPTDPIFYRNISGGAQSPAQWTFENRQTGITISERGNYSTDCINLWGSTGVISPELFLHLNIPPGDSQSWSRTYSITEKARS